MLVCRFLFFCGHRCWTFSEADLRIRVRLGSTRDRLIFRVRDFPPTTTLTFARNQLIRTRHYIYMD